MQRAPRDTHQLPSGLRPDTGGMWRRSLRSGRDAAGLPRRLCAVRRPDLQCGSRIKRDLRDRLSVIATRASLGAPATRGHRARPCVRRRRDAQGWCRARASRRTRADDRRDLGVSTASRRTNAEVCLPAEARLCRIPFFARVHIRPDSRLTSLHSRGAMSQRFESWVL